MPNKRLSPPKTMQALFWSSDVKSLNLQKDKDVIVHRILSYGSLNDLRWLLRHYSKKTVKSVFLSKPKKYYTLSAFNFVNKHLLQTGARPDKKKYVKNLH
jgi:hypothetical protein